MKKNNDEIEKYRVKHGPLGSDSDFGNNGLFVIPTKDLKEIGCEYPLTCIVSDGGGWDHVSVSLLGDIVDRCPNWDEMCFAKDLFFEKAEWVVQYHPAADKYVNVHPFVLHLWRPQNVGLPVPEQWMV